MILVAITGGEKFHRTYVPARQNLISKLRFVVRARLVNLRGLIAVKTKKYYPGRCFIPGVCIFGVIELREFAAG